MPNSKSQMSCSMKTMKQTAWGYVCRETKEQRTFKTKSLCDMSRKLHSVKCSTCNAFDYKYPTIENKDQLQKIAKQMCIGNIYSKMRVSNKDLE